MNSLIRKIMLKKKPALIFGIPKSSSISVHKKGQKFVPFFIDIFEMTKFEVAIQQNKVFVRSKDSWW